jgi:hypothetical protein
VLDKYLEDPEHGKIPEKPGICFGFTVHEKRNNFELELFFNDLFVKEYQSIPQQIAQSAFQKNPKANEYALYSYYGFAYLQNWAANTILRQVTRNKYALIVGMTIPMKIDQIKNDPFAFLLSATAPYFFMLCYVPMLYRTTFRIVQEKECSIRQSMRNMGMQDSSYWVSWFLYHFLVSGAVSLMTSLMAGNFIFSSTPFSLLFTLFALYGVSLFGLILTT